jgi:MarR family transcriptional regulator, organic hydroperoxide resistance regulator
MSETLILGEFLPYLLNRAGVQTGQIFTLSLTEFGLTLPEWRILIALWQAEEQRLTDLSSTIAVDYSTLSRQVAGLEKAGLAVRKRSTSDARAVAIALTAKGKKLTARIIPIARAHEAAAVIGLTREELRTLQHCLKLIFDNLKAYELHLTSDVAQRKTRAGSSSAR